MSAKMSPKSRVKILFPKLVGKLSQAEIQRAVDQVIAARREREAAEKSRRRRTRPVQEQR